MSLSKTLFCLLSFLSMVPVLYGAPPQILLLQGEPEYGSSRTLPVLAEQLAAALQGESVLLQATEDEPLPDLSALSTTDLLILYIRFQELSATQRTQLDHYFASGKPALAFRTTSHGLLDDKGWFVPLFGGHYKGHAPNDAGTRVALASTARTHPVVAGLPPHFDLAHGGVYHAQPLTEKTTPLLFGKTEDLPAEPVAWISQPQPGQRLFYTSLGTESDFDHPAFQRLILNAARWCLGQTPSDPANPSEETVPPAPSHVLAENETPLFLGENLDAWKHWDPSTTPQVIEIDHRADTTAGGPVYQEARWDLIEGTLVARPGYGDIITAEAQGDAVYHLDFLIPEEPSDVPQDFQGNGGVFIDGKWEIQLINSHGRDTLDDRLTCGALYGFKAPDANACGPPGTWQNLQIAVRHETDSSAWLSVWLNGIPIHQGVHLKEPTLHGFPATASDDSSASYVTTQKEAAACRMDEDFTAVVRFRSESDGPLFGRVHPQNEHRENDKVLFIAEGQLHYDIGWVGVLASEVEVTDGDWHTAALRSRDGRVALFVDGEKVGEKSDFTAPDSPGSVLKLGAGAPGFPDDAPHWKGDLAAFQFFPEALGDDDLELALASEPIARLAPAFAWENQDPSDPPEPDGGVGKDSMVTGGPLRLQADTSRIRFANITTRPLAEVDHASIIRSWDDEALARGEKIYQGLCFACHGNLHQAGSLPTSRPFWKEPFRNGKDPLSLYHTLKNGYNQMPPQPWLTAPQAYDVIHYIRETFVKPNNPQEYVETSPAYLDSLPKGIGTSADQLTDEQKDYAEGPKYLRMNFGPVLNWTFQVAPDNIAYKGIAIRLDKGPGGVSRGRHWMVYDHDTLRLAAAWSGDSFVDWKGIAFDQSHGTHTSIVGETTLINPVGPGWAHPQTGSWEDPRFLGRDDKPYGPLPRDWAHYKGQYLDGDPHLEGEIVVLKYTVGDALVLEKPGMIPGGAHPVFLRSFNIGASSHDLALRVAPAEVNALISGESPATLSVEDGFQVMRLRAADTPVEINLLFSKTDPQALYIASLVAGPAPDLRSHLQGGPSRWTEEVTTEGLMHTLGTSSQDPFAVDEIALPVDNPWGSWMRVGGFDFLPGGQRAAVATWLGDVWLVDGIDGPLATHRWKRIATGLFQPLGVKWSRGHLYVTCRDQLARLHDFNGDEEIDFVESFNNDHQVTEHFHEFAMGLQTDEEGNFYYAKSARHAKTALVPHHGTLLRVSADGSRTDILATGFRAANGVCLNPDGSFIVTDQEGHWNPKNRINYVREGGFYGNMFGYHELTDSSDEAMEQPLCWITNAFDRSPGELLWVPDDAQWGPLNGQLLNLSYGTGQIFLVPHEKLADGQAQGGMVSLGLEFPTGIMRGRFHPDNGQLYATGMFAWAGSKHQDGGFYRIRATDVSPVLPIGLEARHQTLHLDFTAPLDPVTATQPDRYHLKIWDLKRTQNYGSPHLNERELPVTDVSLSEDGKTLSLQVPKLEPTWCMEIHLEIRDAEGHPVDRVIHNTIHQIPLEDAPPASSSREEPAAPKRAG